VNKRSCDVASDLAITSTSLASSIEPLFVIQDAMAEDYREDDVVEEEEELDEAV
jgi:hypothetical protein